MGTGGAHRLVIFAFESDFWARSVPRRPPAANIPREPFLRRVSELVTLDLIAFAKFKSCLVLDIYLLAAVQGAI